MRLLRRSTNRFIFWLLRKSRNVYGSVRASSIETNSSRKKQRLESTAFLSRFSLLLQQWTDCWHAAKSTSLGFNSYGTKFPCFWIISMALRCFEMTCWVTPNSSANSSCAWHESSASNASNSESSKMFSFPPQCQSLTSKSPLLKHWNHWRHVLLLRAASPWVFESIR